MYAIIRRYVCVYVYKYVDKSTVCCIMYDLFMNERV
jgi:hypothetical protein